MHIFGYKKAWSNITIQYNLHDYEWQQNPSIYTTKQLHDVCKLYLEGKSYEEINKITEVSIPHMYQLIRGTRYKYIHDQYDFSSDRFKKPRVDDDIKHKICQELMDKIPSKEISQRYNISTQLVNDILKRKRGTNIAIQYNFEHIYPHLVYHVPYNEFNRSTTIENI